MKATAVAVPVSLVVVLAVTGCGGERSPHARRSQARGGGVARPAPAPVPARPVAREQHPRVVHLTIAASGDLLAHLPVIARARAYAGGNGYDFAPMLRALRPLVRGADLALCHVETPLVAGHPSGFPVFRTPPELARAIRATGWDACSTASNHTLDAGQAGIDSTIAALRRAGVHHTGSFASAAARRRPVILRARGGVRIAFLAYTATTNGIPLPHSWSVNLADAARIVRDARRARRAGAQVVIVNLHWGSEYQHAPDAQQLRLAARLTRSRAITAIVGQHVHVVQPIRRVHGRWVVFGEGNLLSNQTPACCPQASQDGLVALLRIRVGPHGSRVERVDYVPTWVRHPNYTVLPVGRALRRREADAAALRASWHRTVGVVGCGRRLRPLSGATARAPAATPRPRRRSRRRPFAGCGSPAP